ncbi:MAG: CTP synthase (glutamine hydrolyzing) [Phycisphaerales bacterium]|nr:MAG: CTP synthase (glutamine hydrolyzing) [Phycisphaerales bacterium]
MSWEDVLSSIGHASEETEFFTPLPTGYKPGKTKYVIVFGTVMSGLGKGIFSSSLARVMQEKGFSVAPIKLEGYLNRDSGTLNPYRHGEVFVLDDGMECDMDLGTYERMLNMSLSRRNFITSGQILSSVLEKERKGGYLGRDVQMIPHVTGEVKLRLRELAVTSEADVVFVEMGGTVGDFENAYIIEAVREMSYEEGPRNFCFVALTYVVEPPSLGEQKSKPAQLNLKLLNAAGIHPHIIACRASQPVTKKVREKIALFANVPMERVFSMHDCDSVYVIPEMLRGAGIDVAVVELLGLGDQIDREAEENARAEWNDYINRFRNARHPITIGIIGKYTSLRDSYASIIQAIEHAGTHLGAKVRLEWIDSSEMTDANAADHLTDVHGVIVPGGFGFRGVDGKIACVKYVRQHGVPFLGICYGMQIAVIEFARNACGLNHASSAEIDRDCPEPVVDLLPEQKGIEGLGGNMRLGGYDVMLSPGSLVSRLSGDADRIRLRFRHRYEVNPCFVDRLEQAGLVFSGSTPDGRIMQVLELPESRHPFFVATQAHPELTSRPLNPQPFFVGLVRAALIASGVSPESVSAAKDDNPSRAGSLGQPTVSS